MKHAVFAAIVLLTASASAEFLAGFDSSSGKIWVLCENETEVFVSGPEGPSGRFGLDASHQASITPSAGGGHIVQCGRETLLVQVFMPAEPQPLLAYGGYEAFALAALAMSLATIAIFLFAARFLFSQTYFCKEVHGAKSRLTLRAGSRMENISVRDPVAIGYGDEELEFRIPSLEGGKEWTVEYEYEADVKNALPASLEAESGGRKISMLAFLIADSAAAKQGQAARPAKRKIAKGGS